MRRSILSSALLGLFLAAGVAQAQPYEPGPYGPPPPRPGPPDIMQRLHWACDHGDRNACIRFGIEIGRHQERVGDWRHAHPDWFVYER